MVGSINHSGKVGHQLVTVGNQAVIEVLRAARSFCDLEC